MVFSNKATKFILQTILVCTPFFGFANITDTLPVKSEVEAVAHKAGENHEAHAEPTDIKSKIDAYKQHHVLDSHDFSLFGDEATGKHYGFSLPIILWDNGVHVFSSSKFEHGHAVAESNGNFYKLGHDEKIYKTDASGTLTGDEHHPTNAKPIDFSITKGVLSMIVVAFLMFFVFAGLAKSYTKNGGIASGVGRFFEPIVLYVRDEIAIPNIGEKHYKRYMSYLLTVFFFIWFLNIFGLTPLGINVTGNIAVTCWFSISYFFNHNIYSQQKLLGTHFLDARRANTNENNFGTNRIIRNFYQTFRINDTFVCQHDCRSHRNHEFIGIDIYL